MTTKYTPKSAETLDAIDIQPIPTPRRLALRTLRQVRSEMSRVYRDVRLRQLNSSEGARLVFMLVQIGKMIELADLEQRITRLETLRNGNT